MSCIFPLPIDPSRSANSDNKVAIAAAGAIPPLLATVSTHMADSATVKTALGALRMLANR